MSENGQFSWCMNARTSELLAATHVETPKSLAPQWDLVGPRYGRDPVVRFIFSIWHDNGSI